MRTLILADSRWRDAFGVALLKHHIPDAFAVSFDIAGPAVELLKPDVLVLNHIMGERNKKLANYVRRQGGKVVIMPTEGRPNTDKAGEWFVEQNDDPFYADLVLSWHEWYPFKKVKEKVVGCPRFEIYQDYKHLIQSRERVLARYNLPDRETFTVASSFPRAKFAYRNSRFHEQDSKDLQTTKLHGSPTTDAQKEYRALSEFKLYVRALAKENCNLLIKPHPMEDVMAWQQICDEIGATLVKGEYIFNLLAVSDLHIARAGCLTIQEAWMMGVPAISIALEEVKPGAAKESLSLHRSASHIVDFLDAVYEKGGATDRGLVGEYLHEWGFTRPQPARKAADAIKKLGRESTAPRQIPFENYAKLGALIKEHSAKTHNPQFDYLGHYGKAVTGSALEYWREQL